MPDPRPRPGPPRLLRLPRPTARLRLSVLYGAAFLACGAAALAVVAYLLYGHTTTQLPSSQPKSFPSAVLHDKVPIADVQQAGRYDIVKVPVRVPIADVQQAGGYDVVNTSVPVAAAGQLQGPPALTPAQQAKLLADAQFHINYDKREILIICAIALAAIAVAAAAIGWIIAGRVLRPLSTITAAARRIAASSLHERLGLHGPDDELKELADTLDDLFARLEASFDAQRRFAANASHELRTPLTRERTLLQVNPRRPRQHRRHLAGRQPATARLQRRAGTPHRVAAHPGQQRSRRRRARAPRPGGHHQRRAGRSPPRDRPPRPECPRRPPARHPRR
ncbi:MAG TPA: HAMP domain-containing protein [Streptosporangiaceae bacterium]|nr:HAMP domain-containing protein [Streptosporangiaceae bacterium]